MIILDLGPAQLSTRFHRNDPGNRDRGRGGGGGDRFSSRGGGSGGGMIQRTNLQNILYPVPCSFHSYNSSMSLSGGGYRDDRPPYRGDRGGGPAYDNRGNAPYYRDDRYDNYSSGPSRGGDRDSRGGGYDNYR